MERVRGGRREERGNEWEVESEGESGEGRESEGEKRMESERISVRERGERVGEMGDEKEWRRGRVRGECGRERVRGEGRERWRVRGERVGGSEWERR